MTKRLALEEGVFCGNEQRWFCGGGKIPKN
jgi:hypothetical protein